MDHMKTLMIDHYNTLLKYQGMKTSHVFYN